jgi:LmbE family N-acetylglucosaminyl deacetylase
MRFSLDTAEVFVPDGTPAREALARTNEMAIGAHPDDLEIMAASAIVACFRQREKWFCGIVVTNGAGSPREGAFADYTDEQMRAVRREEQKKAAALGEYGALVLLDHPSVAVKDAANKAPVEDLRAVLSAATPRAVYTHNPTDKHDTHVAVALRVIEAIRGLPPVARPERLLGCEGWRGLDWLSDADKVLLDCSTRQDLQAALLAAFDSQIGGGKRYDLATMGRRRANATFLASHATDAATGLTFAMDLTPLIVDPSRDIAQFTHELIERFSRDVAERLRRLG